MLRSFESSGGGNLPLLMHDLPLYGLFRSRFLSKTVKSKIRGKSQEVCTDLHVNAGINHCAWPGYDMRGKLLNAAGLALDGPAVEQPFGKWKMRPISLQEEHE